MADPMTPRAVTDAMALAAMREFSAQKGESHDALWSQLEDATKRELIDEWRAVIECALLADPLPAPDAAPTHQYTVCPECGEHLDSAKHEIEDCAGMSEVAREVLCRVFDDGADKGMDEWQDFYAKGGWFWWGRALGAFIRVRLDDMAADGSQVRLLNERLSRLYEINRELRDAAPDAAIRSAVPFHAIVRRDDLMLAARLVDGPAYYDLALRLAGYAAEIPRPVLPANTPQETI